MFSHKSNLKLGDNFACSDAKHSNDAHFGLTHGDVANLDEELNNHIKETELDTLALLLECDTGTSEKEMLKKAKENSIPEEMWRSPSNSYRIGLCGELTDKTLDLISKTSTGFFKKVKKVQARTKDGSTHFYAITEDNTVIEPTYKQFLYRLFIDPATGKLNENDNNTSCLRKIDAMPGIFIGKKEDLCKNVENFLKKEALINDPKIIAETTAFWKIA